MRAVFFTNEGGGHSMARPTRGACFALKIKLKLAAVER